MVCNGEMLCSGLIGSGGAISSDERLDIIGLGGEEDRDQSFPLSSM